MTSEPTDCSDDCERLLAALVLLHSTDTNSTEELRQMLEDAIERKLEKSKNFRKTIICQKSMGEKSQLPRKYEEDDAVEKLHRPAVENGDEEKSEDAHEKEEIPRISIPDEGSADGIFCKVCNGTKLGPMILLECQDCQEAYHPLCHCPPVIDIDVYDPRLVWRCSECIINNTAAQPIDQYMQRDVNNTSKDFPERSKTVTIDGELVAENSGLVLGKYARQNVNLGQFSRLRGTISSIKRSQTFQSRKRIGLKRSINRRNARHTLTDPASSMNSSTQGKPSLRYMAPYVKRC